MDSPNKGHFGTHAGHCLGYVLLINFIGVLSELKVNGWFLSKTGQLRLSIKSTQFTGSLRVECHTTMYFQCTLDDVTTSNYE